MQRLAAAISNRLTLGVLERIPQYFCAISSRTVQTNEQVESSCVSVKSVTPQSAYIGSHAPEPPDPLQCCGSGCTNCVWIEYGTQLVFYYSDRPIEDAMREIDQNVSDVCMREYIKGEIRRKTRK